MNVSTHSFTHIGHREENQDRLAVLHSPNGDASLLLVADGLGGHRGGALAAQAVVDTAVVQWEALARDRDAEDALRRLVNHCEAAVRQLKVELRDELSTELKTGDRLTDPHSTIAALLIKSGEAISIHAGDSRILQFSESGLVERTLDHSVAQLHVLRGLITDEEMATDPDQTVVFSQIGGRERADVEVTRWDLSRGTRFVVCSDGFWELFRPGEMLDLFSAMDPGAATARRFHEKLRNLKDHDNTTAVLAEVSPQGGQSAMPTLDRVPRAALIGAALLLGVVVALAFWTSRGREDASALPAPSGTNPSNVVTEENAANDVAPPASTESTTSDHPSTLGSSETGTRPDPAPTLDNEAKGRDSDRIPSTAAPTPLEMPDAPTPKSSPLPSLTLTEEKSPKDESDARDRTTAAAEELMEGDSTPIEPEPDHREAPRRPVFVESTHLDLDLLMPTDADAAEVATHELRRRGRLGERDELKSSSRGQTRDTVFHRSQQQHEGIPVFGAEIVVTVRDGRLVAIDGTTVPDIRLDAVAPEHDYPTTIDQAAALLANDIAPEDEGLLVVFGRGADDHRLAWRGVVVIDAFPEEAVFDAETAEVLSRMPLVHDDEEGAQPVRSP